MKFTYIYITFLTQNIPFFLSCANFVSLTVFIYTNATGNSRIICRPLNSGSEISNNPFTKNLQQYLCLSCFCVLKLNRSWFFLTAIRMCIWAFLFSREKSFARYLLCTGYVFLFFGAEDMFFLHNYLSLSLFHIKINFRKVATKKPEQYPERIYVFSLEKVNVLFSNFYCRLWASSCFLETFYSFLLILAWGTVSINIFSEVFCKNHITNKAIGFPCC